MTSRLAALSVKPDFSIETLQGRWRALAADFLMSAQGRTLVAHIDALETNVYPPTPFKALELTPFESVRAVIIGQDPYHTPGKAEGLAFSVGNNEALPPSLKNIFKELAWEEGCRAPVRTAGSLVDWAHQGVLLLNTILTVEEGKPLSHAGLGWEAFTNELIETLSREKSHLVFVLWGRPAQQMRALIDERKHAVIDSSHPSPFSASRGPDAFMLSRTFSRVNEWLAAHGEAQIDWRGPVSASEVAAAQRTERKKTDASNRKKAESKVPRLDPEQPSLF